MRKYLLLVLILCKTMFGLAQPNSTNNIVLTISTPFSFTDNSISTFESSHTLASAFKLTVKTGRSACSVYMQLSSWSYPATASPSSSPLYIDYVSTNSTSASNIASSLNVINSNQLMFNQAKTGSTFNFVYSLRLIALNYAEYTAGSYSYTITFTMTQP